MDYVIKAAETAGLGNCSNMLRKLQAKTVYNALNIPRFKKLKRINYAEPGAGISTFVVYKYLIDKGYDVGRIFATLVEPSEKRLRATADKLKALGLKEGKDFVCIVGKDSEMPLYIENASQHIITANATLHHHAYQDRIFKLMYNLLAEGGFFGNFDWFEGLCEHPARVYQALKNYKFKEPVIWETKEEDLEKYAKLFPKSLENYTRFSPADEMATDMITEFWLGGWTTVRAEAVHKGEFDPRDDIIMHEAHGRPKIQENLLKRIDFKFDTSELNYVMEASGYNGNPHQILTKEKMIELGMDKIYKNIPKEGSNLLMGFFVQKA